MSKETLEVSPELLKRAEKFEKDLNSDKRDRLLRQIIRFHIGSTVERRFVRRAIKELPIKKIVRPDYGDMSAFTPSEIILDTRDERAEGFSRLLGLGEDDLGPINEEDLLSATLEIGATPHN